MDTAETTSTFDCFICHGKRFYTDNQGIWHNCPNCNPLYGTVFPSPPYINPYPLPYPEYPKTTITSETTTWSVH